MTRPRRTGRLRAAVTAAVAAATMVVPAFPAGAHDDDLPFVLRFPQDAHVTTFHNDWGAGRSGGRRHQGNDLMAPKLTAVYAAADGIVETVAINRRAGRYVVIAHEGGWTTMYAHLNNDTPGTDDGDAPWSITVSHLVYEGVRVEAGQLIAWVGDSGNAEGSHPHTHFELAHDGVEVNPYPFLIEIWERDQPGYLDRLYYSSGKVDSIV